MQLAPGSVIDRYELVEVLGQGGFATVWRARHTVLGSEHALKVLDPRWVADDELRGRFLSEGRIQATLEHPNIVRVTDLVVTEQVAGLVMGLVRGRPLDELLQSRMSPLAPDEAAQILLPVLDACGFAHERGVIHRDLKPGNVLVEERRGKLVPMVLDFGIAKLMEHAEVKRRGRTRTGVMMGSIDYMSPEQVSGAGSVDQRTDVFALGVLLAQLLTRALPFGEGSQFEVMSRIVEGRLVDGLEERLEATPLGSVALHAMAPRVDDRFDSCEEMAEAVKAAAKGHSTERRRAAQTWAGEVRADPVGPPAALAVTLERDEPELALPDPETREEVLRIVDKAPEASEAKPGGWWSFQGRASRTRFWLGHLVYGGLGLLLVLWLVEQRVFGYLRPEDASWLWMMVTAMMGALPLAVRRLHDVGWSAFTALFLFTALVVLGNGMSFFVMLFLLWAGIKEPTPGPNAYGSDPRAADIWLAPRSS